jgi:hypothetical protein
MALSVDVHLPGAVRDNLLRTGTVCLSWGPHSSAQRKYLTR